MTGETRIALMNYDYLVCTRGLDDVSLDWPAETLAYGNGGVVMGELCRAGFTYATSPEGLTAASRSGGSYDEDSLF